MKHFIIGRVYLILGIVYLILGIYIVKIIQVERENKKEPLAVETTQLQEYDYTLSNINDIIHQQVSTTYHDYIVILDDGKVVSNGVLHVDDCKCKKQ